jgi:hypothetical protein
MASWQNADPASPTPTRQVKQEVKTEPAMEEVSRLGPFFCFFFFFFF